MFGFKFYCTSSNLPDDTYFRNMATYGRKILHRLIGRHSKTKFTLELEVIMSLLRKKGTPKLHSFLKSKLHKSLLKGGFTPCPYINVANRKTVTNSQTVSHKQHNIEQRVSQTEISKEHLNLNL